MLIALAGLPGTGKTTLAAALRAKFGWAVLSKDITRAEIWPGRQSFSAKDNDFVVERLLADAERLLREGESAVVLDGRTFSKREQVAQLRSLRVPQFLVECRCSEETALARLDADRGHLAPDRSPELYRNLKASSDLLDADLVVDTDLLSPDAAADLVESHMRHAPARLRAPPVE